MCTNNTNGERNKRNTNWIGLLFQTYISVIRENVQWYIWRFETIYEKDKIQARLPNNKINIEIKEIEMYPQSYACMYYLNEKEAGRETNMN